ncbi:uncharacterized protein isoform X2 [Rhodnius prolixus]|uniref:uncharacterized protein isoform X2 n=1 Tax=Rhodnius prolixus TaxID=13249 RepID=UPI003D18D85F
MALINIAEESDVEIIPSSCPLSEKTEQELTFPLHHRRNLIDLNVQSPSVSVAENYCYVNSLPRNRRRLKKKPFGFVSELSQKLSPSQEHEFWSPSKLNGDISSKYNKFFNKEKISKANTSDSFVYNINKSCSPSNVTNSSLPCLSLSPYNEKRSSEVVKRQIFTVTNAANSVSGVEKTPENLLDNANKLNSIHSPNLIHSNSSFQNSNVIEESELILSADFFAGNQLTVPITEGLHPLKRKISESQEEGDNNNKKEAVVSNEDAMSSTKITEGELPGVYCNEIGGLIQRQTNGTIDDFASGAVGDRSLGESHSSPEKVCGSESSSNKKGTKKMKVGISTEGHSNTKNVIGSDSPRKLRDKKLAVETSNGGHESPKKKQRTKKLEQEALTDGNSENTLYVSPTKNKRTKKLEVLIIDDDFTPEKVSGCDSSLKKLQSEILLNETSIDGHSTPKRITGHESPKKKRGVPLDNVVLTDGHSNPELITGYESSTEIQQTRKLKVGISTVGHSSSENAIERESSPPTLRYQKFVDDTLKDGHSSPKNITSHKSSTINEISEKLENTTSTKLLSSPEKVTECDISPKKLQKKTWLDETLSDGGRLSPAKVSRYDSSLEKYRNKKSVDEALSNSSLEQGTGSSESRTKGLQTKKLKDRKSIDDHISKVKVTGCFSTPKKVGNEKLLEELSSDGSKNLKNRISKNLFSPEKVDEFVSPSKKQRKKSVSTEDLFNQQISTGIDNCSKVEKYKNSKPPENEGNTGTKDEGSKDDEVGAKINSECELPDSDANKVNTCNGTIRKEYKKRLKNKRSIDRQFNKEIINDSECSTNKKRCSDLEDSDCHDKPPESDRIKKERRRNNSKTSMSTSSDALSKNIENESNVIEDLVKVKWKKIKKDGHSRSNSPSTAKNDEESETSVFRFNLQLDDIPLTDKEIRVLHKKLIKTYVLPEELCAKLQKLQIKIAWKLSPFHEDYTFLHNGEFSYADKCSLSNTNLMEGPFEIEENEAIVNQWKTFCKLYGFNSSKDFRGFLPRSYDLKRPSPLPKRQKLKFVQFLAKDLPDRLLHTVYARFIAMFKHYCKGRFKSEEDELLLIFMKYSNNRRIYSILSSILHRSRFTIYRRMKRLSEFYGDLDGISLGEKSSNTKDDKSNCGENESRGSKCSSRTHEVTETLRKTISHLAGSEDVQKWDSFSANNSCWYRVGKKCKITPVEAKLQYLCSLRVKSLLHTIPRTSSLPMRIIQKLKEHHWKKWKDISWNLISDELSHLGSVFLYLTFRRYVKKNVPSEFWGKYSDCLDYIEQNNLDVDSKDLSEHR